MDSRELINIINNYNDAVAVDMEDYGFMAATCNKDVEAFIVRGISDNIKNKAKLDIKGKNSKNKNYREVAIKNAIEFAFKIIKRKFFNLY